MKDKEQPTERPVPKPPIYPVWVIEVACQALTALVNTKQSGMIVSGGLAADIGNESALTALRIIRDGLASHERAIKGEP